MLEFKNGQIIKNFKESTHDTHYKKIGIVHKNVKEVYTFFMYVFDCLCLCLSVSVCACPVAPGDGTGVGLWLIMSPLFPAALFKFLAAPARTWIIATDIGRNMRKKSQTN